MGGRRTFIGTTFQAEVGAYIAGLLLTERPLSRLGAGLPGKPQKIQFETPTAVDDMLVITGRGEVYLQAKRTIRLETKADGELASVASQFVRQFRDGVQENGVRRDLIPLRDRLVLAVGTTAAATVTENLREALDRNRTNAATAVPKELQKALKVFTSLLDAAWLNATGAAITPARRQELLALCSVIVVGEKDRQLVEEALIDIAPAGAETALADLLETWASKACRAGVGGDAAAIRLALNDKIRLTEPPGFHKDIRRLTAYSEETRARLAGFTTIEVAEGLLRLDRPFADVIVREASHGSLAVTGEPGAGKSAILWTVAGKLSQTHPMFCFTVAGGANNLDALRAEIGLEHPLLEVLKQVPGPRPAYIVLDALDASRGGYSEETYRQLLEAVATLPDWVAIASVRTFDLKRGKAWQRLFRGSAPVPEYTNKDFVSVRHLHLGLLDDAERAELGRQSPTLHAALVASGPKLEVLARNPFNLALLAELLQWGTPAAALARVATRGQLLYHYWEARIEDLGNDAYLGLTALVTRMLKARTVALPRAHLKPGTGDAIDDLLRAGVLLQSPDRVEFRHHILFDYAVARVALLPDPDEAKAHFHKKKAAGLLIAPSLGYWLEGLKQKCSPRDFWWLVAALVAEETIDPIVRVEVARLIIELVQPTDNLAELALFFRQPTPLATQSFRLFVVALMSHADAQVPFAVGPWAQLLDQIGTPPDSQLGIAQTLLETLLNAAPDVEATAALGRAARALFARIAEEDGLSQRLSSSVVPNIARTYATDPVASRQQLEQIFEPGRFARFGHLEVPALARHLLVIAASDPDLAVQLYYCAYQDHEFSRTELAPMMRSYLLSMNTDVAQAFRMARYELSDTYPSLLAQFPATGVRALAAALLGERQRHPRPEEKEPPAAELPVGETAFAFEEDKSVWWAGEIDADSLADYAKLYQVFRDQLPTLLPKLSPHDLAGLILRESSIALVWRVLFEAGTAQPAGLGMLMWNAAASKPALLSPSTHQSAINMLAAIYPQLSEASRAQAENEWLAWDFTAYPDSEEMRTEALGKLFEAIGEAQLTTEQAKAFLRAAKKPGISLENDRLWSLQKVFEGEREWPARESSEPSEDNSFRLATLIRAVHTAQTDVQARETPDTLSQLQQALQALDVANEEEPGELSEAAVATLAQGTVLLLAYSPEPPVTQRTEAVSRLLKLTYHPLPEVDSATEADFASSIVHNFSRARIEVAKALATAAALNGLWPLLAKRFEEMLLHDPHPAVRCQLAEGLPLLIQVDTEAAWQLTEKFVATEQNLTVLRYGMRILESLAHLDVARVEPFVLALSPKTVTSRPPEDWVTRLVVLFGLRDGLAAFLKLLESWVVDYATEEDHLNAVLYCLRDLFAFGYGPGTPRPAEAAVRTRKFTQLLSKTLELTIRAWPSSEREPNPEEISAHRLFNGIAAQFFFGVGYKPAFPDELKTLEAQRQFLTDYAPLISRLTKLGDPNSIHYLSRVINRFVEADPELCFDLFSEAILHNAGVARYEHEPLGVDQFVELVTQYLAGYRYLFENEARRNKLIECLALFVDAGWPKAWQLFRNLPDLLQ